MKPGRGARSGARAATGQVRHIPVLLADVLEQLGPADGETYIDATFGAGGYARAMLEHADCRVLAIDRDLESVRAGAPLAAAFTPRLTLTNLRFGDLAGYYSETGLGPADGAVFDLGVSSMQIDEAERGFSFQSDGPLDMRMTRLGEDPGPTAADLVNGCEEATLANILFEFGEERRSRAIARAIVAARQATPITTTLQLSQIVSRVLGRAKPDARHPATRTFQALRIAVNDELGEIARGLAAAESVLRPGGRLVVVTFHSLEDRIVKRFLTVRAGRQPGSSRHLPPSQAEAAPSFRILNHRPITPDDKEIASNPRARSAKLRAAVRTGAPSWPLDLAALSVPALALDGPDRRR